MEPLGSRRGPRPACRARPPQGSDRRSSPLAYIRHCRRGHTAAVRRGRPYVSACGEADQVYHSVFYRDEGIDGEIELVDDTGRAWGTRVCVQLKSGDSHLRYRERDAAEVHDVKNPRHLKYWKQQPGPVYLVIRTGDGVIRWMNVSEYLEQRGDQESLQIAFDGERLDKASVLRVRDELL